jgi:hypothetical protein
MRIRLLIDIETDDIPRLQEYVGEQPEVCISIPDTSPSKSWTVWGRFVGAKEAMDGLDDPALKDPYDRQTEREKQK